MYTHYIEETKEMEPRDGNRFSTTYYNATQEENKKLFDHVEAYVNGMKVDLISDGEAAERIYSRELGGKHKTLDGKPYRICDVMMDIYVQLDQDRNVTKSMINRWNAAMDSLGLDDDKIEIARGVRSKPALPKELFEEDE